MSELTLDYRALVAERKQCQRCPGLMNPSKCDDGVHDSDEIGPWTRWQGALNAELLVIGQDWGDVDYFREHRGLDVPDNRTNRAVVRLLAEAGVEIQPVGESSSRGTVFLTNAILCLKTGGMAAPVRSAWFRECGLRFLRPQIEIIRPWIVVTLGERAYRSVCAAFSIRPEPFRRAVERPDPANLLPDVALHPVYHCSPRVLAGTRVWEQQCADWRRIGAALRRLANPERVSHGF